MMDKPEYLGISILGLSQIDVYNFCYDYIKKKYDNKVKLCYIDTDSFILHMKTEAFYKILNMM